MAPHTSRASSAPRTPGARFSASVRPIPPGLDRRGYGGQVAAYPASGPTRLARAALLALPLVAAFAMVSDAAPLASIPRGVLFLAGLCVNVAAALIARGRR